MNAAANDGVERYRFADALAEPASHYTDAIVAGGFLFISGTLASDVSGAIVGEGDVVAQTEQTFDNIETVLTRLGASLSDVVKIVVYLTDINDRTAVNSVRARRFGESRPTSTLVQVAALVHPEALVEIQVVALASAKPVVSGA